VSPAIPPPTIKIRSMFAISSSNLRFSAEVAFISRSYVHATFLM